jgi:hypothetical protein
MKQTGLGHGSAGTDKQAAEEGGIAPLLQYVTRLMNRIIRKHFGRPDLEFSWVEEQELDPKVAADIQKIKIDSGVLLRNEARDQDGRTPIDGGDIATITLRPGPYWSRISSRPQPMPRRHDRSCSRLPRQERAAGTNRAA